MLCSKLLFTYISNGILKRQCSSGSGKKPGSGVEVLGELGSGVGKGGGGGGAIREAGGSFGKYAVAKEEEYFYKKQKEQLEELNEKLKRRRKACRGKDARKVEDIIEKNRKRIAELDKCFRKKK